MGLDRRSLLRIAGLALAGGVGGGPLARALAGQGPRFLPGEKSITGKRWAMAINPRACEGCRKCTEICHAVHNVPDFGGAKEEVKWIWKERFEHAFPGREHDFVAEEVREREVVVLCNHCDHPPCVRVCPTQATWRRGDGIVMMDMHRCIGCRFCMAACPYGSRSFNYQDPRRGLKKIDPNFPTRTKGVVEKCNFCAERLAFGKIPACAEVCEGGGLVFGDLEDPNSEVRRLLRSNFTIRRKPELGTSPQIFYIM